MKKRNILMTGAGAPGAPGIINCLKKVRWLNLIVGDMDSLASGRFLNDDKFILLPSANSKNFVEDIIRICVDRNIDLIYPLVTKELFKFSKYKKLLLENGIQVVVSDYKSLKIANDKHKLYKHLKNNNIEVPKFFSVKNYADILDKSKKFNYPKNPFVLKYGPGNGSRGIRIFDDSSDLFKNFLCDKPNNLFTDLKSFQRIISDNELDDFFVTEYLPGDEVTVDTIIKNKKVIVELIRKRNKINSGISVAGEFIEEKEITKKISSIISTLDLDGNIGFQFKKDNRNIYQLIEINPRIQGTSVAAMGMGINLPKLALESSIKGNIKESIKKDRIGFIRYYQEVYYDPKKFEKT